MAIFSQPQNTLFFSLLILCSGIAGLLYIVIHSLSRKKIFSRLSLNGNKISAQQSTVAPLSAFFANALSGEQANIKQRFIAAGFYNFKYTWLYMPLKYSFLVVGGGLLYWFSEVQQWQMRTIFIGEALWLVVIIIAPDLLLAAKAKSLIAKISTQLPYLLDLMAVCVQTGMTIEASMSYLSHEMSSFDKDLAHILAKTDERSRVAGLAVALDDLYLHVPSTEMRSFVMTLKQSLQYGSSIYPILITLASDIREVQMLGLEEKIGKLSAKMSIPLIVFIMIPVVILIAAPGIMRMML